MMEWIKSDRLDCVCRKKHENNNVFFKKNSYLFFRHIQCDRQREQSAIFQAHIVHNTVVVLFGHEAVERRERAVHYEFNVAQVTLIQTKCW